jgi:homoserine O-acetyltransferase/O-succinyltransferase
VASVFKFSNPFQLESGRILPGFHLAYTAWGKLNEAKDNAVWIFHALTANSDPKEWWPGLVGEGKFFDPAKYFIICVNMPGSCYGSIGPLDRNPETSEPYYHDFPFFTTRDMIRAYQPLMESLGIKKIHIGIGGSMGGQQLLEWAVEDPGAFEYIFPIATNAFHSSWGKAFNASQRMCIEADSSWKDNSPSAGMSGMKVARSIALISYRHYETYGASQQDDPDRIAGFRSESYQKYQGEKLGKRFNAFSYYVLSQGMDAHHLGRNRRSAEDALQRIRAKTLVIGILSDILYPVTEQTFLAKHIPGAQLETIDSLYGHDGFLLENEKIETLLHEFLQRNRIVHQQLQTIK